MEFLKKKKKILYAGCVFFVIMFLCSFEQGLHVVW